MEAKFLQLISDSHTVFAILGPSLDRLELVNVEPLSAARAAEFVNRKDFFGLIGVVGTMPRGVLAVEIDDQTIAALSQSVCRILESAITRIEEWMTGADSRRQAWSELT